MRVKLALLSGLALMALSCHHNGNEDSNIVPIGDYGNQSYSQIKDDVQRALGSVKRLLLEKGTTFPYYAQYNIISAPEPRPSGREARYLLYAPQPHILYLEEFTRHSPDVEEIMQLYIREGELFYRYADVEVEGYFQANIEFEVGEQTPHDFLTNRGFGFLSYQALDSDLLERLRHLSSRIDRVGMDNTDNPRRFTLATADEDVLIVELDRSGFDLRLHEAGNPTQISYRYMTGGPDNDPIEEFMRNVGIEQEAGNVHELLNRRFDVEQVYSILDAEDRHLQIPTEGVLDVALARGYLLPDTNQYKIVSASATLLGGTAQDLRLYLTTPKGGKPYIVSQYLTPLDEGALMDDPVYGPKIVARRDIESAIAFKLDIDGNIVWYVLRENMYFVVTREGWDTPHRDDDEVLRLISSFAEANRFAD